MKKITLVLCACAIAFAGLLVSCSNDSGDVNLIYRDTTSYDYLYNLSGSKVVTERDAATNPSTDLVTTTVTTSFGGLAELAWSVNDDQNYDYTNYALFNLYLGDVSKVTTVNNKQLSTQADPVHVDYLSNFAGSDALDDDYNSSNGRYELDFYKFDEKFYYGTASASNTAVYTDAGMKNWIADGSKTVEVTGNIEEDDEITIKVTYVVDATEATYPGVEHAEKTTTTVYTYKLSKIAAAE